MWIIIAAVDTADGAVQTTEASLLSLPNELKIMLCHYLKGLSSCYHYALGGVFFVTNRNKDLLHNKEAKNFTEMLRTCQQLQQETSDFVYNNI